MSEDFEKTMNDGTFRIENLVNRIGSSLRATRIKLMKELQRLGGSYDHANQYYFERTVWKTEEDETMLGWKYTEVKNEDQVHEVRLLKTYEFEELIIESAKYTIGNEDDAIVHHTWCDDVEEAQIHIAYLLDAEHPNQVVFE